TKWVRARHAYFSRGWLGETGQLLEEALPTQDSHGKPRNFLLRPQEFLSLVGDPPSLASGEDVLGAWQSFLRSVMRVHQSPRVLVSSAEGTRSRRDAFRCYGSYHRLKPHQGLKNVANLPADAWAAFLDQLAAMKEGSMNGWGLVQEWKTYEVNRYVSIDGFTQITAATSTAYAQLIGANPETYRRWMKCTIRRVDRPSDTETTIPSTLAALFMTSKWLPCDRHGVDTVVALPSDVLLIDPADLSRSEAAAKPHDFLPHLPRHVAGKPGTGALRQLVNLTALDDVDLKAGAKWLAWLQDHTDEHIHSGLRGLWYDMLDRVAKAAANTEAPKSHLDDQRSWDRLLVEAPVGDGRSQVTLWKPAVDEADGQGPVFLPDQPALANQLTGFLRIVACGSYTTDILRLLQWRFGSEAVRPISEVGLRPAADDVDLNAISVDTLPLLREENHGLVRAILAVLAFGRTDRMNLERDPFQAYRRNLMQLRYLTVQGLKVSVTEASNKAIPQPAFVWEDKRCLLVDAGHRRQLRSLLDALGPFLNARDLAQWGYYHLSDLFPDGLDSYSEMAKIEEYLRHRFADRTMLEQLQRRLEADETWVVNRLIPALLSIVPNSAVDEEDVVNRFRKTYATAKSEDAIKATWRELYANEPFPTGFNDLYRLAVSEAPIDRVAHRAFELWGVTLHDWNVKAAKYCPNLAGLRNPSASAVVLAATEKLLPSARALLR
ncbi:MAG: hypothetical protein KDD77_18330, partial [Caldilineaceae bacterium]|nr:hypothetical protein [Caldilineaceae bacterium]